MIRNPARPAAAGAPRAPRNSPRTPRTSAGPPPPPGGPPRGGMAEIAVIQPEEPAIEREPLRRAGRLAGADHLERRGLLGDRAGVLEVWQHQLRRGDPIGRRDRVARRAGARTG